MTLADVALASINMRLGKPPLDDRYEWISPTPSLADLMNERQTVGRRNLNEAWRIKLQEDNKADLARIGAERRIESGKETGRGHKKVLSTSDKTLEPHNTQKVIASAAGVATGTVAKAEVVMKKRPDLWQKAKEVIANATE